MQILLNSLVTKILLIDFFEYDDDDGGQSSAGGPGSEQTRAGGLEAMTDIAVSDTVGNMAATVDDRVRIIDQAARSAKHDWKRLAVVIDRFFFVVFAIILIATCLSFTGYM